MTTNKLAIIGGSGLYDVEEFKDRELLEINTPWGKPSDQILKTKFNEKEVFFLPRDFSIFLQTLSKYNGSKLVLTLIITFKNLGFLLSGQDKLS